MTTLFCAPYFSFSGFKMAEVGWLFYGHRIRNGTEGSLGDTVCPCFPVRISRVRHVGSQITPVNIISIVFLSDEGPSLETLDNYSHISAVFKPF